MLNWFNNSIIIKLLAAWGYLFFFPFVIIPNAGLGKVFHVILVAVCFLLGVWQLREASRIYRERSEKKEKENE